MGKENNQQADRDMYEMFNPKKQRGAFAINIG